MTHSAEMSGSTMAGGAEVEVVPCAYLRRCRVLREVHFPASEPRRFCIRPGAWKYLPSFMNGFQKGAMLFQDWRFGGALG